VVCYFVNNVTVAIDVMLDDDARLEIQIQIREDFSNETSMCINSPFGITQSRDVMFKVTRQPYVVGLVR